ncbi:MAG TPA: hypothetical protein VF074_19640 [Pyrinomonadaceae bacterium]
MKRSLIKFSIFISILIGAPAVYCQDTPDAVREKTRERLGALLKREGPGIKVDFRQSEKNPFNFIGVMKEGLKNAESMEIVIMVSKRDTIGFRIFPHYKGGYINIDKVRNTTQLLRQLVQFNEKTFLFWGADDTGDVFTGYTFTLESGFPDDAIKIVLASIKNSDQFVGEMKPSIDGTTTP